MTRLGVWRCTALFVVVLLLAACSGGEAPDTRATPTDGASTASTPDAEACDRVSSSVLTEVQRYVDSYAPSLREGDRPAAERPPETGDDSDLQEALNASQQQLKESNCDADEFRTSFQRGLDEIKARGPLARAVLQRLTASLTGTLGNTAETVTVRPQQDLEQVLARLAPGSTVRLVPGDYRLAQPLVLLAGVELRGAGRDVTRLTSSATGTAILVLTDERVDVRALTVRHVGRSPATLIVTSPGAEVALTAARISGARADTDANGQAGSGISMSSGRAVGREGGTTLEVTRTEFADNDAAGILLTGSHRASIRRATFEANGQCGICFGGKSSGAVRSSAFRDNAVGIAVFDRAQPVIADTSFVGGDVAIQVTGRSSALVRRASIKGVSRAGVIFSGRAEGKITGIRCQRVRFGIVVSPNALPLIGRTSCPVAQGPAG